MGPWRRHAAQGGYAVGAWLAVPRCALSRWSGRPIAGAGCRCACRVVPLHSHKLIATLQHVLAGSGASAAQRNPLLTRVEVRAGHGAGKPTHKVIAEVSDMYSFAATALGASWRAPKREPAAAAAAATATAAC